MSSALGLLGARPPLGLLGLNARVGALDWNPSGLGSGFPWGSALDSFEARRWLAMAGNGCEWLAMAENGWKWLRMAEDGCEWLETARNG